MGKKSSKKSSKKSDMVEITSDVIKYKATKNAIKCLKDACLVNDVNTIKTIVGSNIIDDYDMNILQYACKSGNVEIINTIDTACISMYSTGVISVMWSHGLIGACEGGHIEIFKQYQNKTALSGSFFDKCLNAACEHGGNIDLVKFIIDQGTTVDNEHLNHACRGNNLEIVKFLIKQCNSVDWKNIINEACYGTSPDIFEYAMTKYKNTQKRKLSLYNGQYETLYDDLIRACTGGCIEIVKFLISNSANISSECLKAACEEGHIEIVKLLISECGTNGTNGTNDRNRISLHYGITYACSGGHIEIVELLVSKGPKRLCCYDNGLSAACKKGHIKIIELMISKGATCFNRGLVSACTGGHIEIVELMISKGADNFYEGLKELIYRNHDCIEIVGLFISHGFNINTFINTFVITDYMRVKLLQYGHVKNMELFIRYRMVRILHDDIYIACEYAQIKMVEFLISKGASISTDTLVCACEGGCIEIVQTIIDHCIKLNINLDWEAGFIIACSKHYLEIAKLMVSKGATNFNAGLLKVCKWDSDWDKNTKLMAQFLLENGATNINEAFYRSYPDWIKADIIHFFIKYGLSLYNITKYNNITNDFRLFCLCCKNGEIKFDKQIYTELLSKYPVYVLFVESRVAGKECCVKKLPVELFRLMSEYV